jgi:GTPase SAR1 family protein
MGKINSKSKYNYRFPTISSSCKPINNHIDFHEIYNKQRLCMKKKVLMLGLDGGGKTDLFNRLVCDDKKSSRINSSAQPTIGKFYRRYSMN